MVRNHVGERIRVNFYFDEQVLSGLKNIAAIKNTTYSELIRVACREYVIREGAKAIADQSVVKEISK